MGTTFLPILLQKYLSNPATKELSMSSFKITDLGAPTLNSDAATKQYVDAIAGGGGASTGVLPFNLTRGSGAGATTIGQFTNPTGDDLQLTAPTGTGKLIFTDIQGIDFTNTSSTFTNNTGTVIQVTPSGATKGIRISGNNDPNTPLFEITSTAGERHFTSTRSGVVQQSQVSINDSTTGGLTMVELVKGNNGTGLSMTKSGTGDAILVTNNGTGYALSTAGTKGDVQIAGTLDQNGRIVQTSGGGQDTFLLTHPSGVGDGLHIVKNGTTGHALNIENNGSGNAINAVISTATGGIYIQKNTNSGVGIPLQINHQNNFTLGQSSIDVNHNTNAVGVNIANAGSTGTMLLTQTGAGYGLNVNKVSGSGNCVVVSNSGSGLLASLTSSGTGISYTHNNTGANAGLTYTKSSGTGGRMVDLTYSNSGSDDIVRIDRSSGGGSGNMLNIISTTNGVLINATNSGTASNMVLTNSANSGSSANASFVKTGTGNGDNVFIRNTDTVGASTGNALSILNQGVGDCLRIQDEAGDTSLFRIDGDGNVGIGVPTTALTSKFVSNGGSGNTTTQILQTNTGISTAVTDTTAGSAGTSQISINSTNTDIAGRSDITLEPSRGTATSGTTPRIRMTVASGSNNGILLQGNNATAGTNFRFGFTSGSTGESAMNVYSDTATRRVRIGQQDIYTGIPSGVLELTRNATPHGTSIPHILLNGTNATGGVVMNCNAGRIENVADPVNAQDVATRAYVLANAGGTPAQIVTGGNSVVTASAGITTNIESLDTYDMLFNSATGVCGMRESVPDVDTYGHIRVANASQNDTRVMECWSGEGSTNPINISTTPIVFSMKPLQRTAFVGQFTVADIRGIAGNTTSSGILNIWKNSGSHGTNSHLNLVGADSPITDSSRVIECNNNGKIARVRFPAAMSNVATGDVLTANSVSTYISSNGVIGQLGTFSRSIHTTRAITIYRNDSALGIGANTTLADGYYYMLSSAASPSGVGLTPYASNGTAPVTMVGLNTISPVTTVQCWFFRLPGQYRIDVRYLVGDASSGTLSTDYHIVNILQGTSAVNPPTAFAPTAQGYYVASYSRISGSSQGLSFKESFVLNTDNGNYFTLGQGSGVPASSWNSRSIVQNNMQVIIEYLGPLYA